MLGERRLPRLMIAGTSSGAGKTTITVGLMSALYQRGLVVQGFKTGPDFIDPSYHTAVTGRPSRNLDGYMCTREVVQEIFWRGIRDADIAIIEGVMGMYDGLDPLSNAGSTAEMSKWIDAPVLLCVDVSSMARSAAAIVLGYQKLDEGVQIAGVIANRAGSERHFQLVKSGIEQMCQVPVLGYLPHVPALQMPERHLGLIPAIERGELQPLFEHLAQQLEATVDLGALLRIAKQAPEIHPPILEIFSYGQGGKRAGLQVVIAVAKDAAFNFYYPENLELLESYGATLVYFSPLAGELIPQEACGLYLGGGFPEEFAVTLSQQREVLQDFRQRIVEQGLPTFAECGGYMFLCRTLTTKDGQTYPMAGVLPAEVTMQAKLAALGYREVVAEQDTVLLAKGESARGHEFHYSTLKFDETSAIGLEKCHAYTTTAFGRIVQEGYTKGPLLAGYTHLHFASNPKVAKRFVEHCRKFQDRQLTSGGGEQA